MSEIYKIYKYCFFDFLKILIVTILLLLGLCLMLLSFPIIYLKSVKKINEIYLEYVCNLIWDW